MYNSDTYNEYVEFISKKQSVSFPWYTHEEKSVKVFANSVSDKCIVKILDFYKNKIPEEPEAFYSIKHLVIPVNPGL